MYSLSVPIIDTWLVGEAQKGQSYSCEIFAGYLDTMGIQHVSGQDAVGDKSVLTLKTNHHLGIVFKVGNNLGIKILTRFI